MITKDLTKEVFMITTKTKTEENPQVLALAEFLVKYQVEDDGCTKVLATAIKEAKERIEYHDFKIRSQNSVDGKEHIFTFDK